MKRLTVHLEQVKKTAKEVGRDDKNRPVKKDYIYNTITVRDLKTEKDVNDALSKIKAGNKIAKYKGKPGGQWKPGQEMISVAWHN
tara:strand:+ start:3756 stop:4010 length:255 start_codon:yes stop_codon:yes gene_type:complete